MFQKLRAPELTAILKDLLLITTGILLYAIGAKAILAHHSFITGGLYGASLLINRLTGTLTPGIWNLLFNIPLFYIGWRYFSRRFFFYNAYGIILLTVLLETIELNYPIQQQLYAAIATGVVCGAGSGIIFRSRGAGGGLDIVALFLLRKWNIGVGKFYLAFNCILFSFLAAKYDPDVFVASLILSFTLSTVMDQVMTLSNSRKIVYILSDHHDAIVNTITHHLHMGATLISARGAYSGKEKQMVMTIGNNLQMKRLEDAVFSEDPNALFIAENSFNVIGSGLGQRKMY